MYATEVVEHLLGAREGPLRIDDPGDRVESTEERREDGAVSQIRGAGREGQLAGVECRCRAARYFARKTVESARTGNRNDDRPAIHRDRSVPRRRP